MPTYDYQCGECGHQWEEFQSITARPKRKCPDCGKLKAKRMIGTGAGVIFKGSGFYETDYRSDSYKKRQKEDKPESKPKSDSAKSPKKESGKNSS